MAVVEVCGETYHINNQLIDKWDKIKDGKLKKMDNDKIYIVDGRERTGKSTFAIQQACYIDPTLVHDISRICFTADEFLSAIRKTDSDDTHTKCVVFDEAFRGLSSRGAMSKVNKKIIQALMEVGQKNLVIWIVLPSFFMLDLYVAMLRSNALFHVAADKKTRKRVYYIYPHKKKGYLYQNGVRKGWNYDVRTRSKGYFYDRFPKKSKVNDIEMFYKNYLRKKRESLVDEEEELQNQEKESKDTMQKNALIYTLVENHGISQNKVAKMLTDNGFPVCQRTIGNIVARVKEKMGIIEETPYEKLKKARVFAENTQILSN